MSSQSTSDRLPGNVSVLLNPKSEMSEKKERKELEIQSFFYTIVPHSCWPPSFQTGSALNHVACCTSAAWTL